MKRDIINLETPEPESPTLRDMFAMAALQGLLAQSNGSALSSIKGEGAKYAYKYADAMLEARGHE